MTVAAHCDIMSQINLKWFFSKETSWSAASNAREQLEVENLNLKVSVRTGDVDCSAGSRCWSICCVVAIAMYAGMPLINGPQGNRD